jgi:electron transport complex protein RnfG
MASKTESTFLNMVLTLGIISIIASATLGYVYELTKGPIAIAQQKKTLEAIANVTPPFDNKPNEEIYMLPIENDDSLICYPAKKDGKLVGTAISTYSDAGFSERIHIMVGLAPDGTIINTAVLSQKETPGLGDKMQKSKSPWSNQFNGKNPATFHLKVKKDGGDVDAITAATFSSRGFTDAVDRAYKAYMKGGKHE